jgi:hypothetical protein
MKIACEIDTIHTLKKGMKIVIAINEQETAKVMKDIYTFMQKPIMVDLLVDADKAKELMKQITPEQRKKVYAILKDMESYLGESQDNLKEQLKQSFIQATEYEDFSLSDCSKELASDFIEFLIRVCFKTGVPLSENPINGFDDIEKYLALCLEEKKCCICGQPGEVHHCEGSRVGMGRNRNTIDDSQSKKICLCRVHHGELHNIPEEEFMSKYHVQGVVWDK